MLKSEGSRDQPPHAFDVRVTLSHAAKEILFGFGPRLRPSPNVIHRFVFVRVIGDLVARATPAAQHRLRSQSVSQPRCCFSISRFVILLLLLINRRLRGNGSVLSFDEGHTKRFQRLTLQNQCTLHLLIKEPKFRPDTARKAADRELKRHGLAVTLQTIAPISFRRDGFGSAARNANVSLRAS